MAGLRVLVVDADRKLTARAKKVLAAAGHEVTTSNRFDDGLAKLDDGDFEVLIAAGRLGARSGFELCRTARLERDPTLTCVLLVDDEDTQTRAAVAECGAESYLLRPATDRELWYAVRSAATIRHLKQRLVELRAPQPETAAIDPHTGFRTFGYFKEVLFIEVKRARRYGYPVSLLLVSYDEGEDFPASGTEARRRLFGGLAVAIRKCMRDYDIAVSYAGQSSASGDVLVLMPHTDGEGAKVVARRIREAISRSELRLDGRSWRPTVSIGVASSDTGTSDSFSEMVREARQGLQGTARRARTAVARAS